MAKSFTTFAKKLDISNKGLEKIHQTPNDMLQQSGVLTLPDRFNDTFARKGWVATGSMSVDTMRTALELYEAGKNQEAEDEIIAWFQEDRINLFAIVRAKRFNKADNRWHQLREALELTFEERYWSAVPLIVIACDGFASDVLGTNPFEKDADLTAFDSITGHPHSLPFLIKELTLPLRHGILHGQSLGYANRTEAEPPRVSRRLHYLRRWEALWEEQADMHPRFGNVRYEWWPSTRGSTPHSGRQWRRSLRRSVVPQKHRVSGSGKQSVIWANVGA